MVGTSLQFTVPETNLLLQAPLDMRVGLVGWKQARCQCRVGDQWNPHGTDPDRPGLIIGDSAV